MIRWMVAKSYNTLDGWRPINHGMFTIHQLLIRISLAHPQYLRSAVSFSSWWFQATPLKNMHVNWDGDIPNIWENKNGNQTTNQGVNDPVWLSGSEPRLVTSARNVWPACTSGISPGGNHTSSSAINDAPQRQAGVLGEFMVTWSRRFGWFEENRDELRFNLRLIRVFTGLQFNGRHLGNWWARYFPCLPWRVSQNFPAVHPAHINLRGRYADPAAKNFMVFYPLKQNILWHNRIHILDHRFDFFLVIFA